MDSGSDNGWRWSQQNHTNDPEVIGIDQQDEPQISEHVEVNNVDNQDQMPSTFTLTESEVIAIYEDQYSKQETESINRALDNAEEMSAPDHAESNMRPTLSTRSVAPASLEPTSEIGHLLSNARPSSNAGFASLQSPADSSVPRDQDEPARKKIKLEDTVGRPGSYSRLIRRGGGIDQDHTREMLCAFDTPQLGDQQSLVPPGWIGSVGLAVNAASAHIQSSNVDESGQRCALNPSSLEEMRFLTSEEMADTVGSSISERIGAVDNAVLDNSDGQVSADMNESIEHTGSKLDTNEMSTGGDEGMSEKPASENDEGIFDDADEDFELPTVFLSKPVLPGQRLGTWIAAKSNDRSTLEPPRSDSDDDAFGDAEDDISRQAISGEAKKPVSDATNDDAASASKKKKRKLPPLTKPIAVRSPKEVSSHADLLIGKIDLSLVLPEATCRFLAEKFWIFTVEQFEYAFDKSSGFYDEPERKQMRDDIRDAIARSNLCAEDRAHLSERPALRKEEYDEDPGKGKHHSGDDSGGEMNEDRAIVPSSVESISLADNRKKDCAVNDEMEVDDAVEVDRPDLNKDHSAAGDSRESISQGLQPADLPLVAAEPTQASNDAPSPDAAAVVTFTAQTSQETKDVTSSILATAQPTREMVADASSPAHAQMVDDKEEPHEEEPTVPLLGEDERSPISDERLKTAELLLKTWIKRHSAWKSVMNADTEPTDDMETSFSLNGPLSLLLPQVIRNFLSSISVSTAYELLSVRMTEASPLIRALHIWRRHCELQPLKRSVLARQMSGIVNRIDAALSSVPPVDSYTRKWMGSSFVCLTAAAKEFLIGECKLENPDHFIDGQPKGLTDKLVAWRKARHMPPLKGSGKIAMICSWKAIVREFASADKGTGKITTEDEIIELSILAASNDDAEDESGALKDESGAPKPAKTRKKPKKLANEDVPLADPSIQWTGDSALHSTAFLKKIFARGDTIEFLATMGIHTAEQLIKVDKQLDSPAVLELVKWRTATTGNKTLPHASVRCLFDWAKKVKDELKLTAETDEIPIKKRGRKSRRVEAPEVLSALKDISESKESDGDPITSLSSVARSFLGTLGITTAHALLSTRTTDISHDFVKWREDMKMNPLKGTGAIATVSGWKGAVRKKAAGVGNEEPAVSASAKKLPRNGISQSLASARNLIVPLSHPDVLMGLPRRTFFVQNSCDPRCVYEFELSVRQSTGSDTGLFLSYLGAKQSLSGVYDEVEDFAFTSASSCYRTSIGRPAASFLPVLSDIQDSDTLSNVTYDTFAISQPGCGLIELSRYGVAPFPNHDRMEFRSKVKRFLLQGGTSDEQPRPSEERHLDRKHANVLVEESSAEFGKQCFFYASDPIEKGQVIELNFSPAVENPNKTTVGDPFVAIIDRLALARAISVLSLAELISLVERASMSLDEAKRDLKEETGERDSDEELKLHLVERRVHWLAKRIISRLEERTDASGAISTYAPTLVEDAKKLLMTMDDRHSLYSYFKQSAKAFVLEELSHEVLCDAVCRGSLGSWDDKSRWCSVTTKLLMQILRKASLHMLSSCLGDIESQKEILKDMESYVSDAVKLIVSPDRDLSEFAFGNETESNRPNSPITREFFLSNYQRLPKDVVADSSHEEAYLNAMALCDEVAFEDDVKAALNGSTVERPVTIATKMPWQQGSTIMRSIDDVKNGNAKLDEEWYINQVLSVAHVIASSNLLEWESETTETGTRSIYSYVRLEDVVRGVLETNPAHDQSSPPEIPGTPSVKDSALKLFHELHSEVQANKAMPNSLPLFLVVVWPKLRAFGWHMEVGAGPDDVIFYPPGHKRQSQRDSECRMGQQRIERSRKRAKIERRVREAGFGEIPKLMKRVFVSVTRDDLDPSNGASVRHTLKQFVSSVLSKLPGCGDDECRRRLAAIEEAICECFDEIVPTIVSASDNDSENSFGEKRNNSSAYLMQVLLVLPALLEQTGLSMRRIEDTVGVIRDLAQFISSNNGELLEDPVRLCHEEYEADYDMTRPSFLVPRMQKLSSRLQADNGEPKTPHPKSADVERLSEIVLPEDYEDLTDFSRTTLSQMLPCRATMYDIAGKNRKAISVGHGGMICRHCLGGSGEGKYFFSSLDSLNTAATAVLPHLYKCKQVPDDLKAKLGRFKARHTEDRKLKHGAAAAFFSRLWKRLNSSCEIVGPEVYVLPNQPHLIREESGVLAAEGPKEAKGAPAVELKSHIDLLAHIEKTPWSERADLRERIDQYYQCIAYGGELYMTNVMPKNFNSEWILSKLVPPDRLSAKRSLFQTG